MRTQVNQRVPLSAVRKEAILLKCGGICVRCGAGLTLNTMTAEHFVPLSRGGTNDEENLVALCESCNREKGNDIISREWYKYAPKEVMRQLARVEQQYIDGVDFLTKTNLLMYDRFSVPVHQVIAAKSGTLVRTSKAEIRRIHRRHETVDYLQRYKKSLSEPCKSHILTGTDEVTTNYYKVFCEGKLSMVFCLELCDGLLGAGRTSIIMDIFVNPEVNFGLSAKAQLLDVLGNVTTLVQEGIAHGGTKGVYAMCFRAMVDDKRGSWLVDNISYTVGYGEYEGVPILRIGLVTLCGETPTGDIDNYEKYYHRQLSRRARKNEKKS